MKNESVIHIRSKLKVFSGYPNLIPYLCVFFILLVFLIKRTEFVKGKGVQVNLPQTSTEERYYSKKLYLVMDSDSVVWFGDRSYSIADSKNTNELETALGEEKNKFGNIRGNMALSSIVVAADKNVSFDSVQKLMAIQRDLDLGIFFITHNQLVNTKDFRDWE